jgi:glycerophosphoryl diester phosphodiesterase
MSVAPLILGHRGASAIAPENTIAAFSQAFADGADGIEFDVRLSRDGVPAVIHDANLKRTGLVDRVIAQLDAAELAQLDVGSWFSARQPHNTYAGEKLPLLSKVFEVFRDSRKLLYVEMKCEPEEGATLGKEVVRLTREAQLSDCVVIESFDLQAIAAVKECDAGLRIAALFEPKFTRPLSSLRSSKIVEAAVAVGADEIALHHLLAGDSLVEKSRAAGLEVVVWTVDDPRWIKRAESLGIKALIANDPAKMIAARAAGLQNRER